MIHLLSDAACRLRALRAKLLFHVHVGRRGVACTRMAYGIQRRTVCVVPPSYDDLRWIFDQFRDSDISGMFGYRTLGAVMLPRMFRQGTLVIATVRRVESGRRIGFVIMYPPAAFRFWEFGYAIPDARYRNGFDALNTTDAMAHYMFDHLHVPELGWRTREDNDNADAIVRRLGYPVSGCFEEHGHRYRLYRLDQAGWAARKTRLRGADGRPPFIVLPPPCTPVVAPAAECQVHARPSKSAAAG